MKGEAYDEGSTDIFSKPMFLTLVNERFFFFFPFDDLFFHIQTGNNKILHVCFFLAAQVDVSTK